MVAPLVRDRRRHPRSAWFSDFFRVVRVMVPARHVADELRDVAAILRSGFSLVETSQIVNRPIVPRGSQARERLNGAAPEPEAGWYRGQRIQWLRFDEAQLIAGPGAPVPTSPISVMFRGWPAPPPGSRRRGGDPRGRHVRQAGRVYGNG